MNSRCTGLCQYICADASGAMPPRLEPPTLATPTALIRVSNSPPEDSPASGPNAVSSSSSLLLSPALPLASPNLFALSLVLFLPELHPFLYMNGHLNKVWIVQCLSSQFVIFWLCY